jgi:hypothetical protein
MKYFKKSALAIVVSASSLIFLNSCGNSGGQGTPLVNKNGDKGNLASNGLVSTFSKPSPIDSTSIILYPLALGENGSVGEDLLRYSSEYDHGPYWNIAFYDANTGYSKLLDSARTIRINSFQKLETRIIYAVTLSDYNGNNKLDDKDPVYLFTSDLNGLNFRQVSPDNMDARSFQVISSTATLLIQAIEDTNKDNKFGKGDDVIPLIFDASKMTNAKKVFAESFVKEIDQEFDKVY